MNEKQYIIINNQEFIVENTMTIYELAQLIGITIPSLSSDIRSSFKNDICIVEISGEAYLKNAKTTQVTDGMIIKTHSIRVKRKIRSLLFKIVRNLEIIDKKVFNKTKLSKYLDIYKVDYYITQKEVRAPKQHLKSNLYYNSDHCIECGDCLKKCNNLLKLENKKMAIDVNGCYNCGECFRVCSYQALTLENDYQKVRECLANNSLNRILTIDNDLIEQYQDIYNVSETAGINDIVTPRFFSYIWAIEVADEILNQMAEKIDNMNPRLPVILTDSEKIINFLNRNDFLYMENLSKIKFPPQIMISFLKKYHRMSKQPHDIYILSLKKYDNLHVATSNNLDLTMAEYLEIIKDLNIEKMNHLITKDLLIDKSTIQGMIIGLHDVLNVLCELSGEKRSFKYSDIYQKNSFDFDFYIKKMPIKVAVVANKEEIFMIDLKKYDLVLIPSIFNCAQESSEIVYNKSLNDIYKRTFKQPGLCQYLKR